MIRYALNTTGVEGMYDNLERNHALGFLVAPQSQKIMHAEANVKGRPRIYLNVVRKITKCYRILKKFKLVSNNRGGSPVEYLFQPRNNSTIISNNKNIEGFFNSMDSKLKNTRKVQQNILVYSILDNIVEIDKALENVRVADPAVGERATIMTRA